MRVIQEVYNMKKFTEILKEVNKTYQAIKEVEEKSKEIQNTYLNIMDLKERHEKRKDVENNLVRLEEKKKDLQITVKILNSNGSVLAKILMVTKPQKYGSTFLNVIEY